MNWQINYEVIPMCAHGYSKLLSNMSALHMGSVYVYEAAKVQVPYCIQAANLLSSFK